MENAEPLTLEQAWYGPQHGHKDISTGQARRFVLPGPPRETWKEWSAEAMRAYVDQAGEGARGRR